MNVFHDVCETLDRYGRTWQRRNPAQAEHYMRLAVGVCIDMLCAANPAEAPLFEGARVALDRRCIVDQASARDAELFAAMQGLAFAALCAGASMGFPMSAGWRARHAASMAMLNPETGALDHDEDGRVIRPEGWQPPDFAGLLRMQPAGDLEDAPSLRIDRVLSKEELKTLRAQLDEARKTPSKIEILTEK